MAEEDWDTSEIGEGEADPYNKSSFAGGEAEASTTVEEGMENLKVEEAAPAEPPAAPAPPAAEEAPEPPSLPEVETLPPENLKPPADAPVKSGSVTPPKQSPRKGSVPLDAPAFLKQEHGGKAFTEKLEPDALAFFNELCSKPFSEQATAFLNAYWQEVGDQAEFIFSVAWPTMKYADMHAKGVQYIHLYEEGNELELNIGLYFYEKLNKLVESDEGKTWREDAKYKPSMPEMMTAIKRKIELREKVDCNFDGRVSFLEYLLYQYQDFANPADFTFRAMKTMDMEEHPEIVKARKALEEVNKAIQAFEAEKHRLQTLAEKPGVKGLGAKHQLAAINAGPLAEDLNVKLITAEAAVRIAIRKFGDGKVPVSASVAGGDSEEQPQRVKPTEGSVWWLGRDLEEKKKLYGKRAK